MNKSKKEERLGLTKINKWGDTMKIIEYNGANDIVVKFQDEWKEIKKCAWKEFEIGNVVNPHIYKQRIGEIKTNKQGCLMKVVDYIDNRNVIVEFQDNFHERVKCTWSNFENGSVKNHYAPYVYGVRVIGVKYPSVINRNRTKEYTAWHSMMTRCYTNYKECYHTYKDAKVCNEWLNFENFYEWLHSQPNFDKWVLLEDGVVDKDIIIKGNKLYSPETCCLVPQSINALFLKADRIRGMYPIGVTYKTRDKVFEVQCNLNRKETYLGRRSTPEQGFYFISNIKNLTLNKSPKKNTPKATLQSNATKQ